MTGTVATAAPRAARRTSLSARFALVTAAVAALAVVVTALVSYPLIVGAAEAQARETLAGQADLAGDVLGTQVGSVGSAGSLLRYRQLLAAQGITVEVVRNGRAPQNPVTADDVAATTAGETVSDVRGIGASKVLVEGRQVGPGVSVFLVQDAGVAGSQAGLALRRLLLALAVGLAVAAAVGWLVARRITRPLREAASAAERMSTGARDVALVPAGPAEVATVAESLNRLNAALATSEGRQRDFLLSVSHELRTPLTGISGYAEALADGVVAPQDVAATGATVQREAQRLERLVSDLLDLARLGAADLRLTPSPVDLVALVSEASVVWSARCEREGVLCSTELPDHAVVVQTDALRVRQIVDNLAENALRVTPSGRPLVLAVRVEPGAAVLEVRDGGPGLTDDDLRVAFEPAVLHDRYRGLRQVGTGVGLALVGRLAARLGGVARAGRAPEGGAQFSVVLPVAPPAAPTAAPAPATGGPGLPFES
jgi:two-component system sensor histidine kinase BaeS